MLETGEFFPNWMAPPIYSKSAFEFIHQVSRHITRDQAVDMLTEIIRDRIDDLKARGYTSWTSHMTRGDAFKLRNKVMADGECRDSSLCNHSY